MTQKSNAKPNVTPQIELKENLSVAEAMLNYALAFGNPIFVNEQIAKQRKIIAEATAEIAIIEDRHKNNYRLVQIARERVAELKQTRHTLLSKRELSQLIKLRKEIKELEDKESGESNV